MTMTSNHPMRRMERFDGSPDFHRPTFINNNHNSHLNGSSTVSQPNSSSSSSSTTTTTTTSNSPPTKRSSPLTIEEYEHKFRDSATDLELMERVYSGGMESNQLRAALWPYLFGLIKQRGRFRLIKDSEGNPLDYVYIEHENNVRRWQELERLYYSYQTQWKSINADQEQRFSTFRERKALIERDVIRSDRSHPFYAENSGNLSSFTSLLMTYMMYDFDIGYLQGMSDLAAPILYIFNGDLVKSFWVFVEVMKIFRRNFEYSQKTIHFQLNCLFKLIKITDPKFAQYLSENECSNCFFVFRCIVCLFKRELMKNNDENDYTKVLNLWDTVWSVQRRHELLLKSKYIQTFTITNGNGHSNSQYNNNTNHNNCYHHHHNQQNTNINNHSPQYNNKYYVCNGSSGTKSSSSSRNNNIINHYQNNNNNNNNNNNHHLYNSQADLPRSELTETEKFVLSLCLSLIRRERNHVLNERLDASEIHQHFINPRLSKELDNFIEGAYHIYHCLNTDSYMKLVIEDINEADVSPSGVDVPGASPKSEVDIYDLLRDYLIISPSTYSTSRYKYSVSQKSWDLFLNNSSPLVD